MQKDIFGPPFELCTFALDTGSESTITPTRETSSMTAQTQTSPSGLFMIVKFLAAIVISVVFVVFQLFEDWKTRENLR